MQLESSRLFNLIMKGAHSLCTATVSATDIKQELTETTARK